MIGRNLAATLAAAIGVSWISTTALARQYTVPPTQGPAENGSPAWYLRGSYPDPTGWTYVSKDGTVTIIPREERGPSVNQLAAQLGIDIPNTPGCRGSVICQNRRGPARGAMMRVTWEENLGYTFEYPYHLPEGYGGVPAVALDSKGNLWVFKRSLPGQPQLFKFNSNYELVLAVPMEEIGYQVKAHGMAVDPEDNVWIVDTNGSTVQKISPDGKLLLTIGERGRRGDWDEERGIRLLWQPVMVAFGRNGDVYIGMGHGNESPNDVDSDDPNNNYGASRILHLDKNGNFINQWFGHNVGPGKFNSAHGLAVDPLTGDVWIGDREDYRIVIYSGDGKYLRTLQMRNLVCAIQFDPAGNPWMGSGQDGQFLKLDRDGRVIGAVGRGMGIGHGEFIEASYWVFDQDFNMYAGDTSVGRVTKMVAPRAD